MAENEIPLSLKPWILRILVKMAISRLSGSLIRRMFAHSAKRISRAALLFAFTACAACQHNSEPLVWKGDLISPGSCQPLGAHERGTFYRTTHHTNGQVGRTVWQVTLRQHGAGIATSLITVERVLDEPIPGMPFVHRHTGETFLCDKSRSYIYSLQKRSFVRNLSPEAVYSGSYQDKK